MKRVHGFTLLELLCTVAITSLLFNIATPPLTRLISRAHSISIYNQLLSAIQYTRSKSAFLNEDALLCPTTDNTLCVNDWQLPIMIFIDVNKNRKRDPEETIDRMMSILKQGDRIFWKASGTSRYLRFKGDGSTGAQNGSFYICPVNVDEYSMKRIIMYRSGRARRAREDEIKLSHCQ